MTVSRRALLKGVVAGGAVIGAGALATRAEARERKQLGPDDVGMLYDTTKCVGCRACVTKCKEANSLPYDSQDGMYDAPVSLSSTTKNVIQVAQLGEGRWAFVKNQCMHCVDPACVSVCMAGALHREEGGIVAYNKETCVGCRYCQVACAFNVPKFEWNKALPAIVKCELCRHRADPKTTGALALANPACCEVCPREAVVYGKRSDLVERAKVRIASDPGAYNPKIYGLSDGGGTHVLYVTAKGVEFEDLGLPKLPEEPLPAMGEEIQHTVYKWFAAPTILYGLLAYTIVKNKKTSHGHEEEHR
jgi:Fe-S-cluster-containing dehydrogenase component